MTTLRLHQFPSMLGVPNVSPFCCKLETWLRMTGLDYEVVPEMDASKGPTKKLPWIEDGDVRVGDTTLVIEHLVRTRRIDPDADLGAEERATALCVQRMLEEHGAWVHAYRFFVRDEGWAFARASLDVLPAPLRPIIGALFIRRRLRTQMWAHGLGRLDHETILRAGAANWASVAALLGDRPFLFGDRPHTVDAVVFGFLAATVRVPIDDALRKQVLSHANLVAYVDRGIDKWFPALREAS